MGRHRKGLLKVHLTRIACVAAKSMEHLATQGVMGTADVCACRFQPLCQGGRANPAGAPSGGAAA
eukprot:4523380-Prymnesium_polylepis.1